MARRPKPQVVTLTKAAADRIGSVLSEASDKYVGVRVGVKNGGCAGMEYVMDYAETAQPMDECVEDQGVRIFYRSEGDSFSPWVGDRFSGG